jgi:hypothetical protein
MSFVTGGLDTSFIETENSLEEVTDKFDSVNLKSPTVDKNPIYAEVNKIKKSEASKVESATATNDPSTVSSTLEANKTALDVHTLTVLWLILSGCNVEECLLEGNEMAGVNFGAFLPTDPKVLKLLLEAGAVEQTDVEGCEYESQVSFWRCGADVGFCRVLSDFFLIVDRCLWRRRLANRVRNRCLICTICTGKLHCTWPPDWDRLKSSR